MKYNKFINTNTDKIIIVYIVKLYWSLSSSIVVFFSRDCRTKLVIMTKLDSKNKLLLY